MWLIYEVLLVIGLILYLPSALWRRRLPHRGWTMRLGWYPADVTKRLERPGAIWIHAVSVGEVMAVPPLIQRFVTEYPERPLVVSTMTPSGFAVASKVLGDQAVIIYGPLDLRWVVRRALQVIRPRVLLLVESELWPVWIHLSTTQRIPVVVINGRVSARAYRRYLWVKPWLKGMLESVDQFLMQSDQDAQRLIAMGAPPDRVKVLGSLKWDASVALRPSEDAHHALAQRLRVDGEAPLIVAGSTHRGEELVLMEAFQALRRHHPSARLVIAPRHLERVGEVEALSRRGGLSVQRASQLGPSSRPWDVVIVDSLGQLPLYYGLATAVFVGGSLIPHGGQNPLEPASLGKPIMFGPFMDNFAEIASQLTAHQAATQLANEQELAKTLQDFLTNRTHAQAMGQRAKELTERFAGCTQRTFAALNPLLTAPPS